MTYEKLARHGAFLSAKSAESKTPLRTLRLLRLENAILENTIKLNRETMAEAFLGDAKKDYSQENDEIKNAIEYLLLNSQITNYQISKDTGIRQTTLSKYATGESNVGNMSLDNAIKLYNYYLKGEIQ